MSFFDYCDADQKRIMQLAPLYHLSEMEQVNFYFMMHQRNKLKSPNFMRSFEDQLLASKYRSLREVEGFEDIDYTKSFIPLRSYHAESLDRQSFQELLIDPKHPPILIRGLVMDSAAVRYWTHEYLTEHFQDVEIIAFDYSNNLSGAEFVKLKLSEIIRSQLDSNSMKHYYINNSAELFKDFPDLIDEVGADRILHLFAGHSVNSFSQIFVGNLRTWGTNWHSGNDISCALMLNGRKRWYFLDPRLSYILRPNLNGANGMGTSLDVRFSLDFHKLHNPLYAYAPKLYFDLEPGDVVIFTKYWPHAVINLSDFQIMANMRMTEADLETMTKGRTTPTLLPIYDNILDSDPDFIKFKFDVYKSLNQKQKAVGDQHYFSAFATAEKVIGS